MTERDAILADAWDRLRAVLPPGWEVDRPVESEYNVRWTLYAFDPSERVRAGKRSREWTAIAHTEIAVVLELARCLALIREGRVPK